MKSTPEPDVGKEEDELEAVVQINQHQQHLSSDEEDGIEQQLDMNLNGYQLMPGGVNGQFYLDDDDDDDSSSEDEDEHQHQHHHHRDEREQLQSSSVPERDMNVDAELVLNTMKNITLTSVPNWAENLSCERWEMIVKQAIKKEGEEEPTTTTTETSSAAES